MRTIHKLALRGTATTHVISVTHKLLSVGHDRNGCACVWVECYDDPDVAKTEIRFAAIGTGGEVPRNARYVGTVFELPLVWHIYQLQ